ISPSHVSIMFIGLRRNAIAVRSNRNGGDGEIEKVTVCMRGSPRLRKSCRQTWADLAPSQHKTHYVTSPHSAKPRRWPPDTCGMAFEKLILGINIWVTNQNDGTVSKL